MRMAKSKSYLAAGALSALMVAGAVCLHSSPASAMTEAECTDSLGGTVWIFEHVMYCVLIANPGNPGNWGNSALLPRPVQSCLEGRKFLVRKKDGSLACAASFVAADQKATGAGRLK